MLAISIQVPCGKLQPGCGNPGSLTDSHLPMENSPGVSTVLSSGLALEMCYGLAHLKKGGQSECLREIMDIQPRESSAL